MNTRLLMTASAVFMGLTGIALSFMPSEILEYLGQVPNPILTLTLQLMGALYFGFAITNWMAKGNLMGGIYGKPLCIGNLAHFLIGGLALLKFVFNNNTDSNKIQTFFLILALIYLVLAISFTYIFFTTPKSVKRNIK